MIEYILNGQIIIDGKEHSIKPIKVMTIESSRKRSYNRIKDDLKDAYRQIYPNSPIAIVILP